MKIQLPKLSCKYGAPMGRTTTPLTGKCKLQRLPLDSGGYDSGGAYWGLGQPLWVAEDENKDLAFVRANNREEAKAKIEAAGRGDVTFYK